MRRILSILFVLALPLSTGCDLLSTDIPDKPKTKEPPKEDTTKTEKNTGPEITAVVWPDLYIVPAPERNVYVSFEISDADGIESSKVVGASGDVLSEQLSGTNELFKGFIPVSSMADSTFSVIARDAKGAESIREFKLNLVPWLVIFRGQVGSKKGLFQAVWNGESFSSKLLLEVRAIIGGAAEPTWSGNEYIFTAWETNSSCGSSIYRFRHDGYGDRQELPYDCGTKEDPRIFNPVLSLNEKYLFVTGDGKHTASLHRIDMGTGESFEMTPPHCDANGICWFGAGLHAVNPITGGLYVSWDMSPTYTHGPDHSVIVELDQESAEIKRHVRVFQSPVFVNLAGVHLDTYYLLVSHGNMDTRDAQRSIGYIEKNSDLKILLTEELEARISRDGKLLVARSKKSTSLTVMNLKTGERYSGHVSGARSLLDPQIISAH